MSLVGPRPERPEFVQELHKSIPYYGERHAVKPGVTGWAQLRYTYGASEEDAAEKLQYDLYYVKNPEPDDGYPHYASNRGGLSLDQGRPIA